MVLTVLYSVTLGSCFTVRIMYALLSAKKIATVLVARSYMHLPCCSYLLKVYPCMKLRGLFYTVATEGGGLNHVHM